MAPIRPLLAIPIVFSLFSLSLGQESEFTFPAPKGPYAVGLSVTKLVDSTRENPYDPEHGPREPLISLFYPIQQNDCKKQCVIPEMPPRTAEFAGLGGDAHIQYCCETTPEATKHVAKLPLVLFSPGLGATRLIYNAMVMELASAGYSVASIDHSDTPLIEYPDGSLKTGIPVSFFDNATEADLEKVLDVRAEEARFVLTQLGKHDVVKGLVPGIDCAYDVRRVGFYGQSFGGATAVETLSHDSRFVGAMNLDGTQFKYGSLPDIDRPVVLFGRTDPAAHNRTNDISWEVIWPKLKGWKRELGMKETRHLSFTDFPVYVKLSGMPLDRIVEVVFGASFNETVESIIGELDGERSFTVITTYVRAFMDMILKDGDSTLFDPASALPEIVVEE